MYLFCFQPAPESFMVFSQFYFYLKWSSFFLSLLKRTCFCFVSCAGMSRRLWCCRHFCTFHMNWIETKWTDIDLVRRRMSVRKDSQLATADVLNVNMKGKENSTGHLELLWKGFFFYLLICIWIVKLLAEPLQLEYVRHHVMDCGRPHSLTWKLLHLVHFYMTCEIFIYTC